MYVMGGGTQAFCFSDGCPVLTWNPTATGEEFLATAVHIDLRPTPPTAGDDR